MPSSYRRLGIGAALTAAVAAAVAVAASAQSRPLALDGTYVLADAGAAHAAVAQAISLATEDLSPSTRNSYRGLLHTMLAPEPELSFQRTGTAFVMGRSSGAELRSPSDGGRVTVSGSWQLEQREIASGIEQRIEKDAISQVYRYELGADRRTLAVSAQVTAGGLSRPVVFELRYLRR